ncbi:hypothetical protein UFOVP116_402 [uncultured Caudovirales phage]|uniref:Uncharacterized protein n=1 Tax=uncultured Caudovirales phage TaxID=2100421 RepID=A0A6J5LAD4_9CAUD|nr:hypothetical protein UFOVP116_402 [uncultured Caudovirales phage]
MSQLIPSLNPLALLDYLATISNENLSDDLDNPGASGMFVFGQELVSSELSTGDRFGEAVVFNNDLIYVGMPGEDGNSTVGPGPTPNPPPTPTPPEPPTTNIGDLYNAGSAIWSNMYGHTESFEGRSGPFMVRYGVWSTPESEDDLGDSHIITREFKTTAAGEFTVRAVADANLTAYIDDIEVSAISYNPNDRVAATETNIGLAAGTHTIKFIASKNWAVTAQQRQLAAKPMPSELSDQRALAFGSTGTQSGYWAVAGYQKMYFSVDGITDWTLATGVSNFLSENDVSANFILFLNNEFWVFCDNGIILYLGFGADSQFTSMRQNFDTDVEPYKRTFYSATVNNGTLMVSGIDQIFRGSLTKNEQLQLITSLDTNPQWPSMDPNNTFYPLRAKLNFLTSINQQFIACGYGTIAYSSDGIFWDCVKITSDNTSSGEPLDVYSAVWFNNQFIIHSNQGVHILGDVVTVNQEVVPRVQRIMQNRVFTINRRMSAGSAQFTRIGEKLFLSGPEFSVTEQNQNTEDWMYASTTGSDWYPALSFSLINYPFYRITNVQVAPNKVIAYCQPVSGIPVSPLVSYDNGDSWQLAFDSLGFALAIYPSSAMLEYGRELPTALWDTRSGKDKNSVPTLALGNGFTPNTLDSETENTTDESDSIDVITVGSKEPDLGQVAVFSDVTGSGTWVVKHQRTANVDPSSINSVFLFNTVSNSKVETLDFIDPAKGRILGIAEQALDYKTCFDPAYYNIGNTIRVQPGICWGPDQVGKIWWDLSTVSWLDYEQGEFAYRSANWGKLFPGSIIKLYVWIESLVPPSQYLQSSNTSMPRDMNDTEYVELTTVDQVTGIMQTRYFFWVTDIGSDAPAIRNGLSLNDIARLIESPQTSGIPYAAFVSPSTIGMWNISDMLVSDDIALHVSYDTQKNDNLIHSEFQLVQEGSVTSALPNNIVIKIIDSLCAADMAGNPVPDPLLPESERYGIGFRPRQGVFKDSKAALRMFITAANRLFIERPLLSSITTDSPLYFAEKPPTAHSGNYVSVVPDNTTLSYLETSIFNVGDRVLVEVDAALDGWAIYELNSEKNWDRVVRQSFNTAKFWNITDWFESEFYAALTKFSYVVNYDYEVQSLQLVPGQTVKVKDSGGGKFKIYAMGDNDEIRVVGIQSATLSLSERLWLVQPPLEIRNILTALFDIFRQEKVLNDGFFALVRYALSEQKAVDWVFKTSFITVLHKIRKLSQYATYQKDNQDFVREFINEVKPYRTKIREYLLSYAADETWDGVVTDFDLPGYYDVDFGRFRSVSGEHNKDPELLELEENKQWADNHTYAVGTIEVINGGTGYTIAPQVIIEGGGGTGATAYSQISNGVVRRVIISNGGTGYTTTPVIRLFGVVGAGAKAVARLYNGTVRKISTTIKFDRYTYDSSMIDWAPNTQYAPGTVITYHGVVYRVNTPYTSSAEFDANYLTLVDAASIDNANDRTMGFYQPQAGMLPRELGKIFTGIEYPGMKIQGAAFTDVSEMAVGADGLEQLADDALDEIVTSAYRDIALGTRPEDINIHGGAYVDEFSSHAPEELIPGIVFDTLDIQVFTRPSPNSATNPAGADIRVVSASGTGEKTQFNVEINNFHAESCIIYTLHRGYMKQAVDYTYDINDSIVEFTQAPAADDIIYVYLMRTTGNNCIFSESFETNGIMQQLHIPNVDSRIITDSAILVNGSRIHGYTIDSAAHSSVINFTTAPDVGTFLHVYLFSGTAGTHSYSDVHTQFVDASTLASRTIELDTILRYTSPFDSAVIVEVDNLRLRPSDNRYYSGDGIRALYPVPTTGDTVPDTSAITVYVDGIMRYENVEYVFDWLVLDSGITCLAVKFATAPEDQTEIVISLSSFAEFRVVDSNHIKIEDTVDLNPNSEIKITSFSTHDSLKMKTRVFSGNAGKQLDFSKSDPDKGDIPMALPDSMNTLGLMHEAIGFSLVEWDISPFDVEDYVTPQTIDILATVRTLEASPNTNYVWVTVNGKRLMPNFDFVMTKNDVVMIASSLNILPTDCIIITTFAKPEFSSIVGYRVFQNMLGEVEYLRISGEHTTTLARDLALTDTEIYVSDASTLPTPSATLAIPGVVFVNGERITYYKIDYSTNTLSQLRRGTAGTGAATHLSGTRVVDASSGHAIPRAETARWNTIGISLVNSDTEQAKFVKSKPSFNPG